MKQLTDDQARVLLSFIGENWSAFVHLPSAMVWMK